MRKSFEEMTPREIVRELDKYIVGQAEAKKAVAIAVRNRIRRQRVSEELKKEIVPKNILMIGPTGVGKTEIARRLAQLSGAPFVKVEATSFTEVGYVGRNVDSMIRELVNVSVNMVKQEHMKRVEDQAKKAVEERILDALLPHSRPKRTQGLMDLFQTASTGAQRMSPEERAEYRAKRQELREKLRKGELDDEEIEIEIEESAPPMFGMIGVPDMEEIGIEIQNMFGSLLPKSKKRKKMKVSEAKRYLLPIESEKLIDMDKVIQEALYRAENKGIVFIDEMDKVAGGAGGRGAGPDVSREGVQRDLLPIVEGTTIVTKYGTVRTDYILFIAAGAFHVSKPSDLIPELQGRFPLRVELSPLTEEDFARILREPKNAITKQYEALLATEGVELVFTDDGIKEIARIAFELNEKLENIGARRLYTVVEKVLEDVSFEAPDLPEPRVVIDAAYVQSKIGEIYKDEDVSAYIL
ncbi:MAG TPA: HslU--HslV peptidase ATPase subunit [Thermotogae bacterium]|nr:HslU--HslV peptidase ATPase subunit [Thermotogota bacterium]